MIDGQDGLLLTDGPLLESGTVLNFPNASPSRTIPVTKGKRGTVGEEDQQTAARRLVFSTRVLFLGGRACLIDEWKMGIGSPGHKDQEILDPL